MNSNFKSLPFIVSGGMTVAVEPLLQNCFTLSHIKKIQAHLITTGVFNFHPYPRSKFLEFCATSSVAGSLRYAIHIFNHIPFPVTNDWNAIIRGLAQSHQPSDAVALYRHGMRVLTCKPDALTCSFTLKACARALAYNEAIQLHSQVIRYGVVQDVLLQTTLLDVYAKVGYLDNASKLFDEMSKRDVTCWNAIIAGLAQGNRPDEALQMFKRMKDVGFKPNEITVIGALSACSQLGAVQEGENVYSYIKSERLDLNEQVCNVVIDMFGKCGYVGKAYTVFNKMKCKKTLVTWNTMIMVLGTNGEGIEALKVFHRMSKEGFVPDNVSYLAALCACNHSGMLDDGVKLFETLTEDESLTPNIKHYGTMVDLLGRSGRLNEAYNIINSIPIAPDIVLWQTLLGACKTYGNVELAVKASKKLVEMGSSSDGDFVLLSNIYAAQHRWKDVGRVRDTMKNKEVKKVPGFSYIDVNGVIHKFVNGDQSHINLPEIYRKIDEIMCRIMEHGYVPETDYVLHDIGIEEKENALSYHSEKLAVAFGLVSISNERSSIRVNKNLRICGDCHEVMKLVSKVYKREIIVRDRTRFHRFIDGSCSCKDYW
ncbi:pentatricopeptide repeat-containing protein At1g34160-like [Rutidosis leptorrhynchoides]|uniref:pentatricopeptide repeat-containing protein At1g34160-like n=1 Tax=Rutidosis leptorrhynchoides TaxID=125765 RepID=UPI003A990BE2